MTEVKSKEIIPISDTHAAIGAGAIIAVFVAWALVVGVGDDFVEWIGGKANLSGWVQAIGSIVAILIAIIVPYNLENKKLVNERNAKKLEAIFFWHNYIKTLEENRINIASAVKIMGKFEQPPKSLFNKNNSNMGTAFLLMRQDSAFNLLSTVKEASLSDATMAASLDDKLPFYILRLSGLCHRCARIIKTTDVLALKDKDGQERGAIGKMLKEIDIISLEILKISYKFV